MKATISEDSDFQIVPSKYNGQLNYWILVNSKGDIEIRVKNEESVFVTYESMKEKVEELLLIDNKELAADLKSILTFADMRRLETKYQE